MRLVRYVLLVVCVTSSSAVNPQFKTGMSSSGMKSVGLDVSPNTVSAVSGGSSVSH
jgi:hypothetical protein